MAVFIAIGAAILAVAVALIFMPKPKTAKPDANKDFENPTAEAGRPLPVVFGTITVKGLNVLWYGDKKATTYKHKSSSGKK